MRETPQQQRPARVGAATGITAGGLAPVGTTALLVATAAADTDGPAALLEWKDVTVLGRLIEQLASLGIADVHVLTRPAWVDAVTAGTGSARAAIEVHAVADNRDDLERIAAIARENADAPLVLVYGDIVTHREALAGVIADPRHPTAILPTAGSAGRPFAIRARSRRGRVTSAGSAYHHVDRPTANFLGVVKIAPADRAGMGEQAERLAGVLGDPPASFDEELRGKE